VAFEYPKGIFIGLVISQIDWQKPRKGKGFQDLCNGFPFIEFDVGLDFQNHLTGGHLPAPPPLLKLLFQNLKVLGTGQKLETRPGDKPQIVPTVTLEVSPEQGERLALAAQEGKISLMLRGQGDQQLVQTLGADASKLFGRPRTPIPPVSPVTVSPAPRTVEMIRGLERAPVNPR